MDVFKSIFECGIVPVIKLDRVEDAVPLCKALDDGGIYAAEITFRTEAAEESIKQIAKELPDVLVGAGTVLNVETCKKAIDAGAKYIVTPGFNPKVVQYCVDNNMPILPGVTNPTDIDMALDFGLTNLKFFPAEAYGGLKTLKAITAPYTMVKFMPTGGIDASNITDYVKFDKIIAVGGSFMVKDDLVKDKKFGEITKLTKDAVAKLHGFEFFHMAINPEENETSKGIADLFTNAFGFSQRETSTSVFSTDFIEIMNKKGLGNCGHIGVKCNNVARAMAYLKRKGYDFDMDTIREANGKPKFVYLKESFGQFKVHLVQ